MLLARCLLVVVIGVACDDVALGKDDLHGQVFILKGTVFIVNSPWLGRTPVEQFAPMSAN